MPDDKKIRNPVTDTLENKEQLEKAGFTPQQSVGLAKMLEMAVQSILPHLDAKFEAIDRKFEAIDRRFEGIDRRFEGIERTLSRTLTIIAFVSGILASVILIGFAILGYINAAN